MLSASSVLNQPMNHTDKIASAVRDGKLMPSAAENLNTWLAAGLPAWAQQSLTELIERGEWTEQAQDKA